MTGAPKWKMWLISVPLLYLLVLFYDYIVAPHIRSWPTPVLAFILPAFLFTTLSYVLLPIAVRVFARWLSTPK